MTWCCIGIFTMCAYACWYHGWQAWGDRPLPPSPPPEPPDIDPPVPETNQPPPFPDYSIDRIGVLDVSGSNWMDHGTLVTTVRGFTLQSAPTPQGPWTNQYAVTLWESAYGCTMVIDGKETNYARRVNGSVTNFSRVRMDLSQPARFYRVN